MVGDTVATHPNANKEIDALTFENGPVDNIGDGSDSPAPVAAQDFKNFIPSSKVADSWASVQDWSQSHRVFIRLVAPSSNRGPLYEAEFQGEVIVQSSAQPFLDACRVLRGRGLQGIVELWDQQGIAPRMRGLIDRAAKLAVDETGTPRFRNHRQHWREAPKTAAEDTSATGVDPPLREEI
jgi:hypothetical protein